MAGEVTSYKCPMCGTPGFRDAHTPSRTGVLQIRNTAKSGSPAKAPVGNDRTSSHEVDVHECANCHFVALFGRM